MLKQWLAKNSPDKIMALAVKVFMSGAAIAFLTVTMLYVFSMGDAGMTAIAIIGYSIALLQILDNFYPGFDIFEVFAFFAFLVVIPNAVVAIGVGLPPEDVGALLASVIVVMVFAFFGVWFLKIAAQAVYRSLTSNQPIEVVSAKSEVS